MSEKIMFSLQEAADYTGLSYYFWWRACKQGKVPFVRAGKKFLLHRQNIERYLLSGDEQEEED